MEKKFDCQVLNLKTILDAFALQEQEMGWHALFTIIMNGVPQHIPTEWGGNTVDQVSATMTAVHQALLRPAQDSVMSGICLWDLLMDQHLVTSFAYAYKIDGRMSGPVLL